MIYVMSDIHGCYEKYREMLKKIKFNNNDIMFILGDVFDRGGKSIQILQDMMMRDNIIPIIGNHDYTAYNCIKELKASDTYKTVDNIIISNMPSLQYWIRHGGSSSIDELKIYSSKEIDDVLRYIETFSLCEEVRVNGIRFVLVHAGLESFSPEKEISEYTIDDVCFKISDYNRQYFYDGTYVVTGHMPTFQIDESYRGKIYHNKNNIAIDCGAAYGEKLGCLCLNTMEEYYV